ncbi:MAG: cytochrome c peroxidase [Alistipes sp.]
MKRLISITILLLLVAVVVTVIYRFNFRKSIPAEASVPEQVVSIIQQNDCLVCHDINAEAPFYASLPVSGPWFRGHMRHAVRFVDLQRVCTAIDKINEADLAKIEQAVSNGSMPITEYKLLHWGTGFNDKEKSVLMQWIADTRAKRFATGLAAKQFANNAIQPIISSVRVDSAKVMLGYKLYHDNRISGDNTVSCAFCHPLDKGGVDNLRTSKGIRNQFGTINAPTVYNSSLNFGQFWNGHAPTLALQAAEPPLNPVEMGSNSWDEITARLRADKVLVAEFATLYPEGITEATVTDAIEEFEKTLLTPNCPFDRYLKGDSNALTAEQLAGYEAFKENDCATCHVGQGLGGQSYEYIGITEDYFASRSSEIEWTEDDEGLYGVTKDSLDLTRLKVPMLRNIALTAPYLHDGTAGTIKAAVGVMFRYQLGLSENDPSIPSIVTFLRTLTGENPHMQAAESSAK